AEGARRLLRDAALAHRAGLLRRSDPWRQPRHGGMEARRLPGRVRELPRPRRRERPLPGAARRHRDPCRHRASCRPPRRDEALVATRLKETDAVVLGVGMVGSIVGLELARAGLEVVGLERGEPRFTVPDFQGPEIHDELRYAVRKELIQNSATETYTFRNSRDQI